MDLRPTQGDEKRGQPATAVHPSVTAAEGSAALPFVIPSEAEGSAVQRASRRNVFRPERSVIVIPTRVPGFPAALHSPTPACAAFSKESRMKFADATNLHWKSGVA
jgi:hypothetical protein